MGGKGIEILRIKNDVLEQTSQVPLSDGILEVARVPEGEAESDPEIECREASVEAEARGAVSMM